ncbi:MAG: hypothetical protein KJO35_01380, partial [Gammaproteobacteria bacterium]|nr:hypothetical protein [Gammaproteobacteria bacterium]
MSEYRLVKAGYDWQRSLLALSALLLIVAWPGVVTASEEEEAVEVEYAYTPPAPGRQSQAEADAKSAGCLSCHTASDAATMHDPNSMVVLGCTDCHGG